MLKKHSVYTPKRAVLGLGFCAVIFLALWNSEQRVESSESVPESKKRPPTMIRLTESKEMEFFESVSADGAIKARFYALVSPRISGIIDDVYVREGDLVESGTTRLFQVDSEKLRQSVSHSKQSLVIARSTLDERKANYDKAEADLIQAEKDFARSKSLYEEKVIPLSQFESDETRVVQLEAMREVSATGITLAEQNVTLAEIDLGMAEKDLRDSVMHAPIGGVVSARYMEPGEMGSPGKNILRIDDTKQLKAAAYMPAQFYPRINPGQSVGEVSVLGKTIGSFPITYKAPAIDSALRTFEVWADIPGDGAYSVPGAQCVLKIILNRAFGLGVPRDAIQQRGGKQWVFVPDGDVAKMVEVRTGLETGGWIELVDPPFPPGAAVVTQGQFLLEDGYPIRERGSGGQ